MVAENPTWEAPRIHGELLKLGFDLSERNVWRWLQRAPRDPDAGKRWLTLLRATINFGKPSFIEATKIHPSGTKVWITQIPATGKIVSDSTGNVFVAGSFGFVITKLNAAGKVLFSSALLPGDDVTDAVVDPFDNVLATGFGQNAQLQQRHLHSEIEVKS